MFYETVRKFIFLLNIPMINQIKEIKNNFNSIKKEHTIQLGHSQLSSSLHRQV
jgi:hypothetical protein